MNGYGLRTDRIHSGTPRERIRRGTDLAKDRTEAVYEAYRRHGCRVNEISVSELFDRYGQAGFIYPAKMDRLRPVLEIVKRNWERLLSGGQDLIRVVTYEDKLGNWASVTLWKTAPWLWASQHLAGIGTPVGSRAVLLGTQAAFIAGEESGGVENWFQRKNRFAAKVFGSIVPKLGTRLSGVSDYAHFWFPIDRAIRLSHKSGTVIDAPVDRRPEGSVIRWADGVDRQWEFEGLDAEYRRLGLRRYRHVFGVRSEVNKKFSGRALVCRGPIGLNFSFFENRCEIVLPSDAGQEVCRDLAKALIRKCAGAYADFELDCIPLMVSECDSGLIESLGGIPVRPYARSVWRAEGFDRWYSHVTSIYQRFHRVLQRRAGVSNRSWKEVA